MNSRGSISAPLGPVGLLCAVGAGLSSDLRPRGRQSDALNLIKTTGTQDLDQYYNGGSFQRVIQSRAA